MKFFINEEPIEDFPAPKEASLGGFMDMLRQVRLVREDQVMISMEIDGRVFNLLEEDHEDTAVDWNQVRELRIKTEPQKKLLLASIQDGRASCDTLAAECRSAAENFRGDGLADANESFAGLATRIHFVIHYLVEMDQHIMLQVSELKGTSFEEIRGRFQEVLEEAIRYQEDADWVMLADLLEYEFAEVFADFAAYLDRARSRVEGDS